MPNPELPIELRFSNIDLSREFARALAGDQNREDYLKTIYQDESRPVEVRMDAISRIACADVKYGLRRLDRIERWTHHFVIAAEVGRGALSALANVGKYMGLLPPGGYRR